MLNERIAELEAAARVTEEQLAQQAREFKAHAEGAHRANEASENARKKWAELARELATLVSLKRRLAEPGQAAPTPTLLASTITF